MAKVQSRSPAKTKLPVPMANVPSARTMRRKFMKRDVPSKSCAKTTNYNGR
jgi:hypothetical protein